MSGQRCVVAVDSGGTHTRVAAFALDGSLLARAHGSGGSPYHDVDARLNVQHAIVDCLRDVDPTRVVALVAGIAMVGRPGSNQGDADQAWADESVAVPGVACPRAVVNDATIAHRGAFAGEPGVMVVAGTGSMILAITRTGREVESGHFQHYAGAARHLAHETVQRILAGEAVDADGPLVSAVLAHWEVPDVAGLRGAVLDGSIDDPRAVRRRYGTLAPAVTAAADSAPLADRALRGLAERTALGVRLLAPLVERPTDVAFTGGLAATVAFRRRVSEALDAGGIDATFRLPALDPLRGAALLALELAGAPTGDAVLRRLASSQVSR